MNTLCCLAIVIALLAVLGVLKFFLKLLLWILIAAILIGSVAVVVMFFSSLIP